MFSPCAASLACSVQPEFSKTKPNFPKNEVLSFRFSRDEKICCYLHERAYYWVHSKRKWQTYKSCSKRTHVECLCARLLLIAGVCVTLGCQNKTKTWVSIKLSAGIDISSSCTKRAELSSAVIFLRGGKVEKKNNDFLKQQKKAEKFRQEQNLCDFHFVFGGGKILFCDWWTVRGGSAQVRRSFRHCGLAEEREAVCLCSPWRATLPSDR